MAENHDDELEFIIPPRLNRKFLLYGFTPVELILGGGLLMLSILAKLPLLIPISALILATSWRAKSGKNARDYLALLYKFYARPQAFTLRECTELENDQSPKLPYRG